MQLLNEENYKIVSIKRYITIFIGSFLFCLGLNVFIVPVHLYNGGVVGVAQIIRTLIMKYTSITFPNNFDITGILNFIMNIPLLILAYKKFGKKFFIRTIFSVITQTIFFSIIPIPAVAIIKDRLAASLVGGLVGGAGVGITLKAGASGGGTDIIGIYFTMTRKNFSVGKLTIYFNTVVYIICTLLFNIQTGIYSIIYSIFSSLTTDKIHSQNINMCVVIFTKKPELYKIILEELKRGVTYWKGTGAYTDTDTYVITSIISKYEMTTLSKTVKREDPEAFIISDEGVNVRGNYEKRL